MTTQKHTPGPWVASGPSAEDNRYVHSEAWKLDYAKHGAATDGHSIAVYGRNVAADTRLIAAAPDLLAALQLAYCCLQDNAESAREAARAAIAKATQE